MKGFDLNAECNPEEEEEQEQEGFVSKQQEDAQPSTRMNNLESTAGKLRKADTIFPLDYIAIGTWHREAKSNQGRLLGMIWYHEKILAWEIQEGNEFLNIQIPWPHISAIKGTKVEQSLVNQFFVLEVQLDIPPYLFCLPYRPDKPSWRTASEEANRIRVHRVRIEYTSKAATEVKSYYEKMLERDARLFQLSTMPFPRTESPSFDFIPQAPASSNVDSHNKPNEGLTMSNPILIEDESPAPVRLGLNVGANKLLGQPRMELRLNLSLGGNVGLNVDEGNPNDGEN